MRPLPIALVAALLFAASVVAVALGPLPSSPVTDASSPSPAADAPRPGGRSLVPVAQASAPGGYALRLLHDRAYVATFTAEEGVSVFDVSDPERPTHLGGIMGTLARSVDVLDYGDRVAVAISTGATLEVWDLTDPREPAQLASLPFGSHNVQVHSAAKVIYNARNVWDGVGGAMEIVDARDPDDVHLERVWTFSPRARDGSVVRNQGCHDLTVFPDVGRAYCAAYEQSLVIDVEDPWNPEILTVISNPLVTSHHTAFPILNHRVLVVGDEFADNFAWGCWGHEADAAPQPPVGGLWFYDLRTQPPTALAHVEGPPRPPEPEVLAQGMGPMCTSHNGMEVTPGSGLLVYGWFHAGVLLVDASDPRSPTVLDVHDAAGAVGDVRTRGGHVFAADDAVGLTVLRIEGGATGLK